MEKKKKLFLNLDVLSLHFRLESAQAGRREVAGSIPGRACRPSRSEFSVVFSETRINTDKIP